MADYDSIFERLSGFSYDGKSFNDVFQYDEERFWFSFAPSMIHRQVAKRSLKGSFFEVLRPIVENKSSIMPHKTPMKKYDVLFYDGAIARSADPSSSYLGRLPKLLEFDEISYADVSSISKPFKWRKHAFGPEMIWLIDHLRMTSTGADAIKSANKFYEEVRHGKLQEYLSAFDKEEKRVAEDFLDHTFSYTFKRAIRFYEAWLHILKGTNAKVVITTEMWDVPSQTCLYACRKLGRKNINIQHGNAFAEVDMHYNVMKKYSLEYPDKVFVWGEYDRRLLEEKGIERQRVVVTGPIRYDGLIAKAEAAQKTVPTRKKSRLLVALVLCDHIIPLKSWQTLIDDLLDIAREGEVEMVFKPHPGDSISPTLRSKIVNTPNAFFADPKIDFFGLAKQSDAMCAHYSTTLMEAIALGTPAFILEMAPSAYRKQKEYLRSLGVEGCIPTKKEIKELLQRLVSVEYQSKFISIRKKLVEERYANWGSASEIALPHILKEMYLFSQ